jgi:hypothetical protein
MTTPPLTTPRLGNRLALVIIALWASGITAIAANDGFREVPTSPPGKLAIAFFMPVALFALAYRLLPGLRAWVAAQDIALLIGLQTWRVLGMVFLFLLGLGLLPATFAIPAGVGDVAVGMFALFVLIAVLRQTPGWVGQARWLVVVGVLDFMLAITAATLSGEGRPLHLDGAPLPILMQSLPMVLIPAFLVPLFMIAHLMVWLKLPATARTSVVHRQPST